MSTNKNQNGERAGTRNIQIPAFVANGIETGRSRLHNLEEQAQDLIKDLYTRGNREIEQLREKIPVTQLREKLPVDEIVDRAKSMETETRTRAEALAEDVERKIHGLGDSILSIVGVASRDQVAALARDLDRLSRRLDRLARQAKPGATTTEEAPKARAAARKPAGKKAPASRARKTKS